jgi:LPXTG-motif cell wall-anchored protein
MLRKILLSAAAGLCLTSVGPAGAQPYTPPTVSVSDTTPFPGQTITIFGSGFPANVGITITINPTLFTTSDAAGAWSTNFTIPVDFPPGVHTIVATGGGVTATTTFTEVLPEGAEGEEPEGAEGEEAGRLADVASQAGVSTQARVEGRTLPATGSGSSVLLRVGVVLLAAGGVLFGLSRRLPHRG